MFGLSSIPVPNDTKVTVSNSGLRLTEVGTKHYHIKQDEDTKAIELTVGQYKPVMIDMELWPEFVALVWYAMNNVVQVNEKTGKFNMGVSVPVIPGFVKGNK